LSINLLVIDSINEAKDIISTELLLSWLLPDSFPSLHDDDGNDASMSPLLLLSPLMLLLVVVTDVVVAKGGAGNEPSELDRMA
jgi:hypothetical protein